MKRLFVLAAVFLISLIGLPAQASIESQCYNKVQGKIAWSHDGKKNWSPSNVNKLCKNTSKPAEPGICFKRVMGGGVSWGSSTKWRWENALDLCKGTSSSNSTISCFQSKINRGQGWKQAISACQAKAAPKVAYQGKQNDTVYQGQQAPVDNKIVTIRPVAIKDLVPTNHKRGDREFGGNGPDIYTKVDLRVGAGGQDILADIHFRAQETKADWSTVEGRFTRKVFTAPAGKKIDRIVSPVTSVVKFRSQPAGFQLLVPGEDFARFWSDIEKLSLDVIAASAAMVGVNVRDTPGYREAERQMLDLAAGKRDMIFRGNHVHNRSPGSGPVALMSIVGDTGGDDISTDTNGKDDTRIEAITFQEIQIRYK